MLPGQCINVVSKNYKVSRLLITKWNKILNFFKIKIYRIQIHSFSTALFLKDTKKEFKKSNFFMNKIITVEEFQCCYHKYRMHMEYCSRNILI